MSDNFRGHSELEEQRAEEARQRARKAQPIREAARQEIEQQERDRRTRAARQKQREAVERLAQHARLAREAAERGEILPMTGREAADLLAVSRPVPGSDTPHRGHPPVGSSNGARDRSHRERGMERER
ncbi:hypothetical protein [Nocardia paucivorans]|uniref:hypothetical protein n=1 Tax=Nocardia paucivorans TaxID=114259 RepID=UPI000317D456|nr:hypothetical protein [Nocardia paucivorans]